MTALEFTGRRIAIIGGAGFIGHNVAVDLARRGGDVHVVDGLQVNNVLSLASSNVPAANRVGEENNGWYVAMTLLDFERSNVASIAANQRALDELGAYMRAARPGGAYANILKHRLAELYIANEVGRLLSYRTAWMQETGKVVNTEASVIKVFATELAQRICNFGVNLQGAGGALLPGSAGATLGGMLADDHMENVSPTIYSGSSEIQRNIIATRGLGLPRD